MANSSREALLHSAMDQLVSKVRKWKAGSGPVGYSQAQDLCHMHKDDIYNCFQDSGLQAWEFHTMLHRAAEYGLVEDMKALWSEVATTFLQMRSGYGGGFELSNQQQQQQHMQQLNHVQQQQQSAPGAKANGSYSMPYMTNGRSSSSNSSSTNNGNSNNGSSAGSKPPGLSRPLQQASPYAAAPNRSPQDDVAGTSTDQHSSRKQQQQQKAAGSGGAAAAGKGAAALSGGSHLQQGRKQSGGASPSAALNGSRAAAGPISASAAPAAAAAGTDVPSLPNGYISAWRNGLDAAGSSKPPSLMAAFLPGTTFQQQLSQQQQQQLAGEIALQAGLDQQQQEEPLDLLPLGLLDDVYDQGDTVVDGPPKSKATATAVAGSNSSSRAGSAGRQQQGGSGKQQQGSSKQRQHQQQQQGAGRTSQQKQTGSNGAQQQQQGSGRGSAAATANGSAAPPPPPQQQQQQQPDSAAYEGLSITGPLSPAARPFPSPLAVGPFAAPQQQQQQQQLGYDLTSPLGGLSQRASVEALQQQQQQQQQLLMLQQQARFYQQQQQQSVWGSSPPMPYMHPLAGAGLPVQPPPPPRNAAATAGGGSNGAPGAGGMGAAAAAGQPGSAAALQQQQPAKPGYAAVAAGLSGSPSSTGGSNNNSGAFAAAGAAGCADSSNGMPAAAGGMNYRSSLGLGAAPGAPMGQTMTDARPSSGLPAHSQQQQQQQPRVSETSLTPVGSGALLQQHLPNGLQQQQHQQPGLLGLQQQQQLGPTGAGLAAAAAAAALTSGSSGNKGISPAGLSLFQGASYDSPLNGPLLAAGSSSSNGAAVGTGPLSPYPSPMHRSLSGAPSGGASPAFGSLGAAAQQGSSSSLGMAPMLLPPSALGAIGEPVGVQGSSNHAPLQQQAALASAAAAPRSAWGAPGAAVRGPAGDDPSAGQISGKQQHNVGAPHHHQQQQPQLQVGSLGSVGSGRGLAADSSSSSASSSGTAPAAASVATSPHSMHDSSPSAAALVQGHVQQQQQQGVDSSAAGVSAQQPQQQRVESRGQQQQQQQQQVTPAASPAKQQKQQQQVPASPGKPLTWAQKLKKAEGSGGVNSSTAAANGPAAVPHTPGGSTSWGHGGSSPATHALLPSTGGSSSSSGPRIAPAPKSELAAAAAAAAGSSTGGSGRGQHRTTGQALLAAARQQEEAAAAAAAAAVPTYSEAAALEGLDETTAKAAVTAASRMPLPAKLIQAWRSGMCLGSLIKLLQSQRPDLAAAVNDRIKGWLCQDCDRSTAECLVLFVLANLRRDWHMTAKNPGAFLMGLLQHRAALIGGSGLSRKLLESAHNFPNVAVYIDSDVLQELGDMEPELRAFVMDEYMCKQRHDWPEGLKFPSQCLLSCMRSIRYADPGVHRAYVQLLASRPDLSKACNGVILYGLCKCDKATGLAAVKRLGELPEAWTSAARVNASAFLYQKVQELCGGHGCY